MGGDWAGVASGAVVPGGRLSERSCIFCGATANDWREIIEPPCLEMVEKKTIPFCPVL
jgi:hypothetical protein